MILLYQSRGCQVGCRVYDNLAPSERGLIQPYYSPVGFLLWNLKRGYLYTASSQVPGNDQWVCGHGTAVNRMAYTACSDATIDTQIVNFDA